MWLTRGLVSFSRRPVGIQRYVTKNTQCNLLESTKQYSVGWLGKSAAVVAGREPRSPSTTSPGIASTRNKYLRSQLSL